MARKMKFSNCFKEGSVVRTLDSTERFQAIKELIAKSRVLKNNCELKKIEEAVLKRERLYTTGIGRGIAIAHGKLEDFSDMLILVGISEKGIDFATPDGKPVKILFLIVNSRQKTDEYLFTLSTLASIMRNQSFLDAILQETDPYYIEKILAKEFWAAFFERFLN